MIERAILRWLRAVAPPDWTDAVLGDLQEEVGAGRLVTRLRLLLQLGGIAARFTLNHAAASWRRKRLGGSMGAIVNDIHHAVRSLRQSPGFSLVAVATLALAIGANTAIYSALSALVLNPLSFPDGSRYVFLYQKNPDMGGFLMTPSPTIITRWRAMTHIFDAVESYATASAVVIDGGEPEELAVSYLRPTTLATLGVRPARGRSITEADLVPDAPPVVLIGHAFWQSRFGGDPAVVGRTLRLGHHTFTVIGVMPSGFELPMGSDALWAAARPGLSAAGHDGESTIARLTPGLSADVARSALEAVGPVTDGDGQAWRSELLLPADYNGSSIPLALYVLGGAVGCLLLIACVNVANLVLSRHSTRARELAIRQALGASRGRLLRYLFVESALVAGLGGLAGLAVGAFGLDIITRLRPRGMGALTRVEIGPEAWLFALGASVATALLIGLIPAVIASGVRALDSLKAGGRSATPAGQRLRCVLTGLQVSLALVLLVGAGLLARSYGRLTAVDPGYDPDGVLSVSISLPPDRYPADETARRVGFFDAAAQGAATVPGVMAAAVGNGIPPESGIAFGALQIQGVVEGSEVRNRIFAGGFVSPSYFQTLRIPVLEGRVFTADDATGREPVVVVSRSFAQEYWPGRSPLGARLRLQPTGPWATVIGVVGDVKALGLGATGPAGDQQLYQARAQTGVGFGAVVVRASGRPEALIQAIKARIWDLDPELVLEMTTAEQLLSRSASQSRFNMALLVAFAGAGLTLALVGVYGVTALFVGQRQREMGIRMALGATRAEVMRYVAGQSVAVVGAGIVAGGVGALWLSRYLEGLVFQVTTTDAVSYVLPTVAVALVAALATAVPVRRAAAVDPAIVLRAD